MSSVASVEAQLDVFLGKYSPAIEAQLRQARARLRAGFPRGFELVFDNYNALVFAISPSGKRSDAFLSVAGYPKWVTLFFLNGAGLRDPQGLLQGQGKQVRGIRLNSAAEIDGAAVQALIAQAALPYAAAFRAAPTLSTEIRTVLASPRPRRPTPAA